MVPKKIGLLVFAAACNLRYFNLKLVVNVYLQFWQYFHHIFLKTIMVILKIVFTLHVPVLAVAVVNVNVAAVAAVPESIYTEKSRYILYASKKEHAKKY